MTGKQLPLGASDFFRAYPPRERWVRDATAYNERRRNRRHTHLVRGGSLMFWPTICDGADQRGGPAKAAASITHLSRGGYEVPAN